MLRYQLMDWKTGIDSEAHSFVVTCLGGGRMTIHSDNGYTVGLTIKEVFFQGIGQDVMPVFC